MWRKSRYSKEIKLYSFNNDAEFKIPYTDYKGINIYYRDSNGHFYMANPDYGIIYIW